MSAANLGDQRLYLTGYIAALKDLRELLTESNRRRSLRCVARSTTSLRSCARNNAHSRDAEEKWHERDPTNQAGDAHCRA
jgi:hypothetical protein